MRMPRLNQYTSSLMTTTPFVSKLPLPTNIQPNPSFGNRGFIIPYTPSPDASINYTNKPQTNWWDDFRSGLDKDFLVAAAQSLGGGRGGEGGGGGHSLGGTRAKYGDNIRPAERVPAGMPVPGTAPNPSFAQGLVLPRRKQDQYSGGY